MHSRMQLDGNWTQLVKCWIFVLSILWQASDSIHKIYFNMRSTFKINICFFHLVFIWMSFSFTYVIFQHYSTLLLLKYEFGHILQLTVTFINVTRLMMLHLCPFLSMSTSAHAYFWCELAASLTSQDLYELWTDPSSLSCADLSQGNENNEQGGLRQSGSCPVGPHCTMGHRTGRAQGPLINRSVHPTGRESSEQGGIAEGSHVDR